MTEIYFLDGLGSNRHYSQALQEGLARAGYPVTYLPLPGHPENLNQSLAGTEDFVAWLEQQLPSQPVILMGFSLGADLAAIFAHLRPERIRRLLLLDGAILTNDQKAGDAATAIANAKAYVASQVVLDLEAHLAQQGQLDPALEAAERLAYVYDEQLGAYRLNLTDTIDDLLTLTYDWGLVALTHGLTPPVHYILAGEPQEFLAVKLANLNQLSLPQISYQVITDAGHDLYQTHTKDVIEAITSFLEN